ncbi:hypothetical protein [Aporhodopirellula aestuarii]|uniref:Uncharacterized protein n=1 Tax=Aporhodopirellula aestuarii TaxID=2950107 RepID=A0ABT0UBT5_9BACT|nr:hypothetical protein [Aporhodopirellula aestuarii]MCM2374479.1 hypothetical protein [Aporhodopirellula aestuarii]
MRHRRSLLSWRFVAGSADAVSPEQTQPSFLANTCVRPIIFSGQLLPPAAREMLSTAIADDYAPAGYAAYPFLPQCRVST